MQEKEAHSEEEPDCLGGPDENEIEDAYDWIETVCDMNACTYRDGCSFYREFVFDGDEMGDWD